MGFYNYNGVWDYIGWGHLCLIMKLLFSLVLLLPSLVLSDKSALEDTPIPSEKLKLIKIESSYNPRAFSRVGAIGLMQVTTNCLSHYNWVNGKQIRPSELYDPSTNVMVGSWYIEYLNEFFSYLNEPDRSVVVYSSYNMGQYRTRFKTNNLGQATEVLIYRDYARKIAGYKYLNFKGKNNLLWKGKRIDLWSLEKVDDPDI